MFHLESSITEWRRQMLVAGIKAPVPLDELENHLREDIEQQMLAGLNLQQAFQAATQKIGASNRLHDEFKKVPAAEENSGWKWEHITFFSGLGLISLFTVSCILFRLGSFAGIAPGQQLSGLGAMALMIFSAVGGWRAHGLFPVIARKRIRDAICITGGVLLAAWWAFFFFIKLPHTDYTLVQLDVAILWAMMPPIGILGGLVSGIETAAWKNRSLESSTRRI